MVGAGLVAVSMIEFGLLWFLELFCLPGLSRVLSEEEVDFREVVLTGGVGISE